MDSQQTILLALAADFNRYLTYRSDAHLTLSGHADHRGSKAYNKALTERRVNRSKNFLVEHGVPASNIQVQSFGDEQNLNAEQIREQIDANPDLSEDDRKKMRSNLRSSSWPTIGAWMFPLARRGSSPFAAIRLMPKMPWL